MSEITATSEFTAPSRRGPLLLLALTIAALIAAVLAPVAQAGKVVDRIVAGGATSGSAAGQLNGPSGLAVNDPTIADATTDPLGSSTSGYIYVAEVNNQRVQVFGPDGSFKFMIGLNVNTGTGNPNVCTSAGAPTNICGAGTASAGAGEFRSPRGVAINQQTGDLYVTDLQNHRVQQFNAAGTFIRTWGWGVDDGGNAFQVCDAPADLPCQSGIAGGSGGQFNSTGTSFGAAGVDVDPRAPHHVFVADSRNRRVSEFDATGSFVRLWGWDVASSGPGNIGTGVFEICSSTVQLVCKEGLSTQGPPADGNFLSGNPASVAVDGDTGVLYASSGQSNIQRFDTSKALPSELVMPRLSPSDLVTPALSGSGPAEVDPGNGSLLVGRSQSAVQEIDLSLNPPQESDRHLVGAALGVNDLGLNPTLGELYITSDSRLFAADADGAPSATMVLDDPSSRVTGLDVTLTGTITPNGPTGIGATYNFQYRKLGTIPWTTATASDNPLGDGSSPVAVSDTVSNLEANTEYEARLVTRKEFGNPEVVSANIETFITDAIPPNVQTANPVGVTDTSAYLAAHINPNNTHTSFYFEWGTDIGYGNRVPIPNGDAGSLGTYTLFMSPVEGLQPGTTYHYRVVADNGVEVSPGVTEVPGADVSFTTRQSVPAPPGRAYELVSANDKVGGTGVGRWYAGLGSMATSGVAAYGDEKFAVQSYFGSTLEDNAGFSFANDWSFSERISDRVGWRGHSPITHESHRAQHVSFLQMASSSEDLAGVFWKSNSTPFFFPEFEADPAWRQWGGQVSIGYLSDWGAPPASPTRWELFGPLDPTLVDWPAAKEAGSRAVEVKFSADGSTAVGFVHLSQGTPRIAVIRGLGGPGDPTSTAFGDLVAGRSLYRADLAAGLTDEYAIGERELLNVCTGAGAERTVLPSVDGSGDLASLQCPDPAPGRDAHLVSDRGAALNPSPSSFGTSAGSLAGTVSEDGSRVFFIAPDPAATGVPNGISSFCSGAGANTLCPAQLFVRQETADGPVVRWISRAEDGLFGTQDPTLTGSVALEGSTPDGDKVFFRTNSPLTEDDPNGTGAPVPGGVRTGNASASSWDLYMYDFPDDPGADPGDGELTRISAGPNGNGDCNSPLPVLDVDRDGGSVGALRAASADGERVYFTCTAPLPGVSASSDPTRLTTPGGTISTAGQTNLYLYDEHQAEAERWRFVARLPRDLSGDNFDACASAGTRPNSGFGPDDSNPAHTDLGSGGRLANCVRVTSDGAFATFMTSARLTLDDPSTPVTGDVYGFDAERDELIRITAPQGGAGVPGPCVTISTTPLCWGTGSPEYTGGGEIENHGRVNAALNLATDPLVAGDRIAFFQSASRLVPEDEDDGYDVYQWRNGDLSLLSSGAPDSDDALYKGNDRSGKNVYIVTRDRLTWQDTDAVADIYTVRAGGGIPEPPTPPVCAILADGCQAASSSPPPPSAAGTASIEGQGNLQPRRAGGKPPRCGRGKVRRGKRCVSRKNARKKAAKKRANHDRRASR